MWNVCNYLFASTFKPICYHTILTSDCQAFAHVQPNFLLDLIGPPSW